MQHQGLLATCFPLDEPFHRYQNPRMYEVCEFAEGPVGRIIRQTKEGRGESRKRRGCNRNASLKFLNRAAGSLLDFAWLASFGSLANILLYHARPSVWYVPDMVSIFPYGTLWNALPNIGGWLGVSNVAMQGIYPHFTVLFASVCYTSRASFHASCLHVACKVQIPSSEIRYRYTRASTLPATTSAYHVQSQRPRYGFATSTQRLLNAAVRQRTRLARDLR